MKNIEARIEEFVSVVQDVVNEDWKVNGYSFAGPPEISVKFGKKYAKIVKGGAEHQMGVHSFVNIENGDILKAASWKAPAKHARGSIFDADQGRSAISPYGAVYLR